MFNRLGISYLRLLWNCFCYVHCLTRTIYRTRPTQKPLIYFPARDKFALERVAKSARRIEKSPGKSHAECNEETQRNRALTSVRCSPPILIRFFSHERMNGDINKMHRYVRSGSSSVIWCVIPW